MTQPFLVLGHRGCRNGRIHQNSMSAFREAMAAADGFETDTAISRDGVIYLIHDITYIHAVEYTLCEMLDADSAARAGTRRLNQMDSAEIDTLRLKNGEPLPRLTEALALFQGRPDAVLNIELKSDNTAAPVVDLLRRTIAAGGIKREQLILSSFNLPAMVWVREHAPEFTRGALFSLETQKPELIYPWSDNRMSRYTPFDARTFDTPELRTIDPAFFSLSLATTSIANIAAILARFPQARFIVWPLYEPTEAEVPYVLEALRDLAKRNLIYAWISDEPRLRKEALAS